MTDLISQREKSVLGLQEVFNSYSPKREKSLEKSKKFPLKTTEIGRTAKFVRRNLMGQLELNPESHRQKSLDAKDRLKKAVKITSMRKFKSTLEKELEEKSSIESDTIDSVFVPPPIMPPPYSSSLEQKRTLRSNAHTPKEIIHEALTLPKAIDQIFRENFDQAELKAPKEAKFTNIKIKKMTSKVRRVPPLKLACAESKNRDIPDADPLSSEPFYDVPSIFGMGNEDQSTFHRPSINTRGDPVS